MKWASMRPLQRLRLKGDGGAPTPDEGTSSAKNWQQAGDIFLEMSAFQRDLAELFTAYKERSGSPRLGLLLDLLTERARKCQGDLADYVKTMPNGLRGTRIQFRLAHTPRSLLGDLCDVETPTTDDITDIGLKADDYFEQTFRQLTATAEANGERRLQEVYQNMWELEKEARASFARQIGQLQDI